MLRFSKKKIAFSCGLLLAVIFFSGWVFANFSYVLDTPSITSGTVVNNTYYYGPVKIGTSLIDPASGRGKDVYYTLNACGNNNSCPQANTCSTSGTWSAADVQTHNINEFRANVYET